MIDYITLNCNLIHLIYYSICYLFIKNIFIMGLQKDIKLQTRDIPRMNKQVVGNTSCKDTQEKHNILIKRF